MFNFIRSQYLQKFIRYKKQNRHYSKFWSVYECASQYHGVHALIKDNLVHALMKYMCIRCMLLVWVCSNALFTVYPYSCIDQRKFEANFNRLLITLILYLHVVGILFHFVNTLRSVCSYLPLILLSSYSLWWYFVLATLRLRPTCGIQRR